jgi:iron complex transport system ATP-binding protein
MLSANQVSYTYPARTAARQPPAVLEVTMNVAPGSFVGLLGPNGCGKTTLLRLLSGVLRPERGSVVLDGRPVGGMARRQVARRIAVVPQETHPAFDFTCLEMVLMGRHPHLGAFQLEGPGDVAIAQRCLAATGTGHLAHRPYTTLSGGEKQRVIIAGALAQEARILLLDEPTASLDLGFQLELASLFRRLNHQHGVAMVLATHDLNLAASVCGTLVLMRNGRVYAQGSTPEVLTATAVRDVYGVEADVLVHPRTNHLTVVPMARSIE